MRKPPQVKHSAFGPPAKSGPPPVGWFILPVCNAGPPLRFRRELRGGIGHVRWDEAERLCCTAESAAHDLETSTR